MIATSLRPDSLLRAFAWARLIVAASLVGIGPWAPSAVVPVASEGLVLTVFALVVSSGALVLLSPPRRSRSVAWLLCLLDAALVTAVVAATGGTRSMLVFLYVPLVTVACLLLSRGGGVAIAAISSVLYAALVLGRSVVPVIAFGEDPDSTTPLDVLTIFVNAGTLAVVSILAGGLADRFIESQRELGRQRRSLADLQAFRDVIFQSVATGLVAVDHSLRITAFNRAAETITGVSAPNALGVRWSDVFGGNVPLREIEATVARKSPAAARHEIELRRPDGTVAPVRVTGSALESGDGTSLGLLVACEDLTAIRAMETRLRQADHLAALGRVSANIAHEIRNPLAALSGAVEALGRANAAPEARDRLTAIVLRESDRLSEIIGNFVEYAHPRPLTVEKIDAAVIVDAALQALTQRLPTEIKVVCDIAPSLPIEADPERLRQALCTLCLNAASAMTSGGELRVTGVAAAGIVEITIADTGDGIAPTDLPHVFEPFFAAIGDDAGLGLPLVHRVVTDHGGEVTVRSERGLGTEFTIRLPERHA